MLLDCSSQRIVIELCWPNKIIYLFHKDEQQTKKAPDLLCFNQNDASAIPEPNNTEKKTKRKEESTLNGKPTLIIKKSFNREN